MSERLERMMKRLEGDGSVEKQIILLKLTEALEQAPEFGDKAIMEPASPNGNGYLGLAHFSPDLDLIEKCSISCLFNHCFRIGNSRSLKSRAKFLMLSRS